MNDDDRMPEYFEYVDADIPETPRRRGCLFVGITFLLIASLVGSTVLTYFVLTRQESRSSSPAAALKRDLVEPGPTAAPATVVAAAMPLATAEPELTVPEITVNRIALINRDGQLETMAPDGGGRRILTLTSDNTRFQFPAWAPDSQKLAIIGTRAGDGAIYILDDVARTGALQEYEIYTSDTDAPVYLYWSPDGQNLAFLANFSRASLGLNVVASDGATGSRLLATGAPFYWDWSHDGQQLLIHSGQSQSEGALALIDLDGQTQAANLATPGEFQAPGIGQGGRYWAFAERAEGGLSALVVVDTQTGERITHDQVGSVALSWSPAAEQIAFTSGSVDGHPFWGPLHVLDMATQEETLLSSQSVLAFFWSPDGRQIAFITLNDTRNDDSINVSAPEKSRQSSRLTSRPAVQNGQGFLTLSVVDVETGQGLRLLDFEPTRAFLSQFLPYFDQYALSHRIWSPDSSALVLPVREEEGNIILVIPTEGGRAYRLAEGEIAFWSYD